jgi:hypothetical protein
MSFSLKESCHLYDKYCRRNSDTPTFQEFNSKHLTCLPLTVEIQEEYHRVILAAKRAQGIPVTRRLPSLFRKFELYRKQSDMPDFVADNMSTTSVQIPSQAVAHKSVSPSIHQSVKMNIRPPACIATEPLMRKPTEIMENRHTSETVISKPELAPKHAEEWSLDEYKKEVQASKSVLLKETNGHMVHLVPQMRLTTSLESLACKLTKHTWESLCGKSAVDLKMRDGSALAMAFISLDEGDLAEFIQSFKQKKSGPHFIRFSRI